MFPVHEISGQHRTDSGTQVQHGHQQQVRGEKRLKKMEYGNAKAELKGKCFVLGSCHSLRSGTEKQQWGEHRRAIPVQSCTWAESNLRDSGKPDTHERFSTNKESITVKQS